MIRFASLAAALAASFTLVSAAAGAAGPGYYVATPIAAPAKSTVMTRETPWNLRDGNLVAARAPVRDLVACQLVARQVGQLSGFTAGGQAFDAASLADCNSKAKALPATVTAAR